MQYIRKPDTARAVVRERMDKWEAYRLDNPGLGVFALVWKETGVLAGYCTLRHVDFKPGNDLELGYVIAPEYQGLGLATETTRALIDFAFGPLQAQKIVAFTDPDNAVSQKVLLKCGFQHNGIAQVYDEPSTAFVRYFDNITY